MGNTQPQTDPLPEIELGPIGQVVLSLHSRLAEYHPALAANQITLATAHNSGVLTR
jgi:hypothetical protein